MCRSFEALSRGLLAHGKALARDNRDQPFKGMDAPLRKVPEKRGIDQV